MALGSVMRNAKDAQLIGVSKMVIHPSYLSTGGRNDIGVIELKTSARLGRTR